MKLNLDRLPASMSLIVELIGLPAVLRLVEEYGGTTIWPANTGPNGAHLADVLGETAAAALCAHFREPIYIPLCRAALIAVEHDAIRSEGDELERGGLSAREAVAQLARKYRYSDRYIWTLRKQTSHGGVEVETAQGSLF